MTKIQEVFSIDSSIVMQITVVKSAFAKAEKSGQSITFKNLT
ncbi:hypothetical protein [Nonlabens antarcticus]|nr:hypothetical protein [Nonlabens antarcticus]